jgi:hypothetical protein
VKVFKKLQFSVTREEVEAISNCVPGAIEKLLKQLKIKVSPTPETQRWAKGRKSHVSKEYCAI